MRPPWVEFPDLPWRGPGWRAGFGGQYWARWQPFYLRQSRKARDAYQLEWPEPRDWARVYETVEKGSPPDWMFTAPKRLWLQGVPGWVRAGAIIIVAGAGFFVFAVVEAGTSWHSNWTWRGVLNVGALFGILGALWGSVAAYDGATGGVDRPVLRALLCAAFGAAAVMLVQSWQAQGFNASWIIGGAVVGAVLGLIGWRWAKYAEYL